MKMEPQQRATNEDSGERCRAHLASRGHRRDGRSTASAASAAHRLAVVLAISVAIASGAMPSTANPVKRDPLVSRSPREGANKPPPAPLLEDGLIAMRGNGNDFHRREILPRQGAQRILTFNQVTRTTLADSISAPRTSAQGLDIGSPNGIYAFVWRDGNPRIAQYDAVTKLVKNRWFLLRQGLVLSGCSSFANTWTAAGDFFVYCGARVVLSVNVATTAGVKARSVSIDNAGVVRYYGSKPAIGTASLLLAITPMTANYTGSPVGNLKTWRWTSTTTRVSCN